MPAPARIRLGDVGQCEAEDWLPSPSEPVLGGCYYVSVRCHREGRRIQERNTLSGHTRWRIVCPLHGLTSAYEVN